MRKVLRAKLRHQAEKSDVKTIKMFRYLWKQERNKRGMKVPGQVVVKKSMLSRGISKIGKRLRLGV